MQVGSNRSIDPSLFAEDSDASRIAGSLTKEGAPLSLRALENAYKAAKGPDADVIKRMIWAARKGKPEGSKSALGLQADNDAVKSKGQVFAEQVRGILDKNIIGQDIPKQALVTALRANPPGRASRPSVLVMTGPSGVGKTEMAKAITAALHGPNAEPVVLEGAMFKNPSDMSLLEGAAPGYVGSDKTEDISPLSEKNLQRCFGGKKPVVLLLDEVDDISPAVRSDFWSKMNKAIDEGYFKLKDGSKIDLTGAIILITSNAGLKTVGNLKGEARDAHFAQEFETAVGEPKILNRIGRSNIVACDTLSKSDLSRIVSERFLQPFINKIVEEQRTEKGFDVKVGISDEALAFLIELGHSDETGARNARQIAEKIIQPLLLDAVEVAGDEDTVTLNIKPEMTDVERNKLIAQFQKANGLPPGVSVESSPFVANTKTINKAFFAYEGQVPSSEIFAPIVHASGLLAGRGFAVFNKAEGDSQNELATLVPGPTDADDVFKSVALPAALAEANFNVSATPLGEHQLYLLGTTVNDEAGTVESPFYVYDAVKKTFTEREAPPIALAGATVTAAGDKLLVTGGRMIEKDGDGFWTVHMATADDAEDAHYDNTKLIENTAWLYDPATNSWEALENGPSAGRCGSVALELDGKVYLMGGEEVLKHPSGTLYSRASRTVDVFDPKTKTFSVGEPLPKELAYASAFKDEHGRINVAGGVEFTDMGAQITATDTFIQFNPSAAKPTWKNKQTLPTAAARLAVVPRLDGAVVGPFIGDEGVEWAKLK